MYSKPSLLLFSLDLAPDLTPTTWTGIRDASNFGNLCPQTESPILVLLGSSKEKQRLNFTDPPISEDCLYLNIYTPISNGTKSPKIGLPVMFWIHGGGFAAGAGSSFDGGMLASLHNAVIVTINYRIGILGFLNVPGTNIKGNYGMLDQVGALKWVNTNIKQFGGDPNKVTIFGESAGAYSVVLHLLSPVSENLFIRAISQSGPPVSSFFNIKETEASDSQKAMKEFGCDDLKTSMKCMRDKQVNDILKYQDKYLHKGQLAMVLPSVDGYFFVEDIRKIIKLKKIKPSVPYMLGFTLNEGTMFSIFPTPKAYFDILIKRHSLQYPNPDKVDALLKYEYTNWETTDKNPFRWYRSFADFQGDDIFNVGSVNFASYWSEAGGTVYLYKFTFHPRNLKVPIWEVTHGIDIDFVFGRPMYPTNHIGHVGFILNSTAGYTAHDRNVSKSVMEMWTNFARTGDPGYGWRKYNSSESEFMNIGSKSTMQQHPVAPKRMALWNNLIPKIANISKDIVDCKKPSSTSGVSLASGCFTVCFLTNLIMLFFML